MNTKPAAVAASAGVCCKRALNEKHIAHVAVSWVPRFCSNRLLSLLRR